MRGPSVPRMNAGLELEALVLEKVFEFPRKKVFKAYSDNTYQSYIPSGKPRRTHEIDARPVPWFSRSMDAAYSVVEQMAKLGYWCQMRNEFESHGGPDCWAGFTPHSTTGWNGRPDHWTQAETLPLAICLAALATLEEPAS